MDAHERGARLIVWLIAGTCVLWSFMDVALYAAVCYHNHQPIGVLTCVLKLLPLLVGIILFAKTNAITRRISDWLE
ncbi:MAG TPA: hypothetical protein VN625_01955 [Desulfuromonadaceae bacterium]|nr:hypothetical protein [Desulfuromonadaceae bacterium]